MKSGSVLGEARRPTKGSRKLAPTGVPVQRGACAGTTSRPRPRRRLGVTRARTVALRSHDPQPHQPSPPKTQIPKLSVLTILDFPSTAPSEPRQTIAECDLWCSQLDFGVSRAEILRTRAR